MAKMIQFAQLVYSGNGSEICIELLYQHLIRNRNSTFLSYFENK